MRTWTSIPSRADKSIARTPGTSSKLGRASTISCSTPGRTSKRKIQKFGEIYSRMYKRTAAPIFAYIIIMIFSPLASQFANCNPPLIQRPLYINFDMHTTVYVNYLLTVITYNHCLISSAYCPISSALLE